MSFHNTLLQESLRSAASAFEALNRHHAQAVGLLRGASAPLRLTMTSVQKKATDGVDSVACTDVIEAPVPGLQYRPHVLFACVILMLWCSLSRLLCMCLPVSGWPSHPHHCAQECVRPVSGMCRACVRPGQSLAGAV